MAENWQNTQKTVSGDLKADGMAFTIRRAEKGRYDPILGQYTGNAGIYWEFTAYGIIKSLGSPGKTSSNYNFVWQQDETIQAGDRVLLLDCSTYSPELEDEVILQGEAWRVKAWSLVEPGMIALIQYVLIRKA